MPATHTTPPQPAREHQPAANEGHVLLLEEVDFKWLMAGQGWWVDTTRLHKDPVYAAHWLNLVDARALPALKNCATLLRAHVGASATA